jgi:MFS family permease
MIAIWAATVLATELPSAALSDRYGRPIFLLAGSFFMAVGGVLLAFRLETTEFVFGVLSLAIGFAMSFMPALATLTEIVEERRQTEVQAINGFVQGLGLVGATIAVGALYGSAPELVATVPSLVCAAALALCVLLGRFYFKVEGKRSIPADRVSMRDLMLLVRSNRGIQSAALITVLFTLTIVFLGNSLGPHTFSALTRYSEVEATNILGIRNLVATAACLLAPTIVARCGLLGGVRWIAVGTVVSTLFLIAPVSSDSVLVVALFGQGLALGIAAPVSNLLVYANSRTTNRAQAFTVVSLASRLCLLISPLLTAVVAASVSPALLLFITALSIIATAGVLLSVARR